MNPYIYFAGSKVPYTYFTIKTLIELQNNEKLQHSAGIWLAEHKDWSLVDELSTESIGFVCNKKPPDWFAKTHCLASYNYTMCLDNGLLIRKITPQAISTARGLLADFIITWKPLDSTQQGVLLERLRTWNPLKYEVK